LGAGSEEEKMDDALREAKLAKLVEIEGYDSADELMEAVLSDSVPLLSASTKAATSPARWSPTRMPATARSATPTR
jgi:hypothetical protein